jgi:NAD(P)-dependent dehydrogenase (short-subunit alcohol dehydrogenase family)/peroxiredoxin
LRDRADEIRATGAEIAIVGNGSRYFASAFREDFRLDFPLFVDPELEAYRAAGLRRGYLELFSPRLVANAVRAIASGSRQTGVQGDAFQLGGLFVIRKGGGIAFAHRSRAAGDHAPLDDVLRALGASPRGHGPGPLRGTFARALSALVDPTIALSFDRTGYRVHALGFDPTDLDVDLRGNVYLVTGANSGIGLATARGLAARGGEVVMLCRSRERGEAAAVDILKDHPEARLRVETLDVSDLDDVRACAARLGLARVTALVHNAGVLPARLEQSRQGFELCLATHVLGPFLLTQLLRPALAVTGRGRIVFVASGGLYTQRLELRDPDWSAKPYDGVVAYAKTKRMQVVLAELLAERLRPQRIAVNAMHPGWADTPSVRESLPRFFKLTERILRTPEEGADTVLWLAASARGARETGKFWLDRAPRRTHLLPWTRETQSDRDALLALCEERTGVSADGA